MLTRNTVTSGIVVELFGSTRTGFALKDSDINMNLRFSDCSINSSVSDLCMCHTSCVYIRMYVYVCNNYECIGYHCHYTSPKLRMSVITITYPI